MQQNFVFNSIWNIYFYRKLDSENEWNPCHENRNDLKLKGLPMNLLYVWSCKRNIDLLCAMKTSDAIFILSTVTICPASLSA